MQQIIRIPSSAHKGLYDITRQLDTTVSESGVQTGMIKVYADGAAAGNLIQINLIAPLL